MKILLSYASEYDKGEGAHWARVLAELGHEVHVINVAGSVNGLEAAGRTVKGYPPEVTIDELVSEHSGAELFLYVEPLALVPRGLEASPIPTACIISDVHRKLEPRLSLARFFDHVFLYHRNYVDRFARAVRGTVQWLPVACDDAFFRDMAMPRDLDAAFIGQLFGHGSERRRIVERLAGTCRVNEQRYYRQNEIPEVYNRAKIVVNLPAGDDLNTRFFEALFCGALLLTRRNASGQEDLFQENVHYVGFSDEKELFGKVDYYLRHESERARIARAGFEEAHRRHTLKQRAVSLLSRVAGGKTSTIRGMHRDAVIDAYASLYEQSGRIESLLRLAAERTRSSSARRRIILRALKAFARRTINGW